MDTEIEQLRASIMLEMDFSKVEERFNAMVESMSKYSIEFQAYITFLGIMEEYEPGLKTMSAWKSFGTQFTHLLRLNKGQRQELVTKMSNDQSMFGTKFDPSLMSRMPLFTLIEDEENISEDPEEANVKHCVVTMVDIPKIMERWEYGGVSAGMGAPVFYVKRPGSSLLIH